MIEAYTLSQSYDRLLEEHKALQSQLTEKDATIKELQRQIGAYKSCTPNAWENAQELDRLRKALEEARQELLLNGFINQDAITKTISIINTALGEGDKE